METEHPQEQTEAAGGASAVERLVRYMLAGGQISNGSQAIYKVNEAFYFMCCDTSGCCDTYFNEAEVANYLSTDDGDEWECVPNSQA